MFGLRNRISVVASSTDPQSDPHKYLTDLLHRSRVPWAVPIPENVEDIQRRVLAKAVEIRKKTPFPGAGAVAQGLSERSQ